MIKYITHFKTESWGTSVCIMHPDGHGFARVYWYDDDDTVAYFDMLSVSQSERKQGIGRNLLKEQESIAFCLGLRKGCLLVENGTWMKDWYIREGYSYYMDGEENYVYLTKPLVFEDICRQQSSRVPVTNALTYVCVNGEGKEFLITGAPIRDESSKSWNINYSVLSSTSIPSNCVIRHIKLKPGTIRDVLGFNLKWEDEAVGLSPEEDERFTRRIETSFEIHQSDSQSFIAAYVSVDQGGSEYIFNARPYRSNYRHGILQEWLPDDIVSGAAGLPKGSIEKVLNKTIDWSDDPIGITKEQRDVFTDIVRIRDED